MTVADRPARTGPKRSNVVAEIAARRRQDVLADVAATGLGALIDAAVATPRPRPIAERLAAPGPAPHRRDQALVAVGGTDRRGRRGHRRPRARLRSRRRGGHLGPVRAALVRRLGRGPARRARCRRDPGPGQGLRGRGDPAADPPRRRRGPGPPAGGPPSGPAPGAARRPCPRDRPGAARRGPRRARARSRARDARPAHRAEQPRPPDARGGRRSRGDACATRCRTIGSSSPSRASASPRSSRAGARSGSMARWSARPWCGRRIRPRRHGRSSPRVPCRDDPANVARRPFVKICGVTDLPGVLAAVAAGADAIGLNVVPGTPRELSLDEAADLARIARAHGGPATHRPTIVAITADAARRATWPRSSPPSTPMSSSSPAASRSRRRAAVGRRTWKVLHIPPTEPADLAAAAADDRVARAGLPRRRRRPDHARRGRRPASGRDRHARRSERLAAAVARELPVVLAGGLRPANVAGALRTIPATAVDVASGVERPREPGERPTKDPLRVALFVKRARAARDDRPNLAVRPDAGPCRACSRPTPPDAGGWSATSVAATSPRR